MEANNHYNIQDILESLKNKKELDPNQHDGSYALMRATVESYKQVDPNKMDYRDLNLVYLTSVGTWKQGLDSKKRTVRESNLGEIEKKRLCTLWDETWKNAENRMYENREQGNASIGMFGTGFFTFKGKTSPENVQAFIKMCIDILPMSDDEEIFQRASDVLTSSMQGMKAASASMILHCLKPFTFPVLNGNSGFDNIFSVLGVKLVRSGDLDTYIDNCRKIKEYRDRNFICKNYRIYDNAAREAGESSSDTAVSTEDIQPADNNLSAETTHSESISEGWWPDLSEYDPGISAQGYHDLFLNEKIVKRTWLEALHEMYEMPGHLGTCKQLGERYGYNPSHYISYLSSAATNIVKDQGTPSPVDDDNAKYWPVLFQGKRTTDKAQGNYCWKMREPVIVAIEMLIEEGIFQGKDNHEKIAQQFPHNLILYGPPGTGKTYYTALYAVSIIEGRDLKDIASEDYADVKVRYDTYAEKGQIAFTTFHQSYGYEEFIEGIKPVMDESTEEDSGDVQYVVEKGVFRSFCEQALTPVKASSDAEAEAGFNKAPVVWKVSLNGTGDNPIREECMKNNHIRIGWDSYGEHITDETDFSEGRGKAVLNAFINKMQIGDVVLSCYSASTIDAVGVITGECEWHPEYSNLRRLRKVKWLAKGLSYNIVEMNGGSVMTLATIYKLNISMSDVLHILEEVRKTKGKPEYVPNQKRYVFIIDEINRGNISKVFGELITLIESSKRIGQPEQLKLVLPYSKKTFGVPVNVYIIGTMNTADRSIALMDTALRRRFSFIEMQPEPSVLAGIEIDGINISEMLQVMNKRVEVLCDREHTIGHSYFMPLMDTPTMDCLASIFKESILPLLQEYFFDDYEKIRLILADNQKPEDLQFVTRQTADITSLFGNTDEEIEVDANYTIHEEIFMEKPEAYVRIYAPITDGE